MKKFFTLVVLALLAVGCAKEYDDTGLRELIAGLDLRISELETNVQALQTAVGDGKFVRKVEEYKDPDTGRTTGITVTYTDGNVVHFNIVPADPTLGPVFSVIRNGAGELVWAVDGIAVKMDGEEVPVYQTPTFSIDDEGNLWVEVDGKKSNLGSVKSEGATLQDGIFTNLAVTDNAVVLTLSDGSKVNIPFAEAFQLNIETTEFSFGEPAPIEIPYTVSAKTEATVVGVAGYSPKDFSVEVTAEKIIVTPLRKDVAAVMLAYADSKVGLVSMVNILIEAEGFSITDVPESETADYLAPGEDAVIDVNAVSNISFEVKPVEDWIHVVEVKSQSFVITLKLDDNNTGEMRLGTVNFVKAGTEEIVHTIVIAQLPSEKEEGPVNLSKKESANTYVVTAAGEYKFKAVKGNSAESVGAVATAEVLWETVNTAEAPAQGGVIASVGVDGEFITFTTAPGLKPGNALIAAKDAAGTILWSWHIWIPATQIATSTYGGIVNYPMMDRNLGALVAPAAGEAPDGRSIGFLYQWGRKDPFPGIADLSSSTPFATNGTISLASDKQNFTVAETIQNPTVYVVTGGDSNKTWMTTEEMSNDFWGVEKTVYDPCPPGYVVPTRDKTNCPLWAATATFSVDEANKLLKVSASADASEFALFPVGGYLDQGSITKVGARSYYWSSYASGSEKNIAYMLYINGTSVTVEQQRMSRGANIRCIAIDENTKPFPEPEFSDPTVNLSKDGTANSYIVTAAGDYKIATVKGNTEDTVGEVASAAVLWETWNTQEEVTAGSVIASVSYADGFIKFSTPGTLKPGNALIAAKDAEGTVLWSWHIWIPQTEIGVVEEANYSVKKSMSRNLGALVDATTDVPTAVESFGLLYEWGRKDPFPGLGVLSGAGAITVAGEVTAQEGPMTVEDAIKNPTVYVYKAKGDWAADGTDTASLWGETAKTVYDPCPVGYMLPQRNKSCAFWSGNKWTEDADPFHLFEANCSFSVGALVFPIAGYIDDGGEGQKKAGSRTIVWSGRWDSGTVNGYGLYGYTDDGVAFRNQGNVRARGGSVRCVTEE